MTAAGEVVEIALAQILHNEDRRLIVSLVDELDDMLLFPSLAESPVAEMTRTEMG